VISVPSEITQVERRAVMESAYRARASEVHLVEQAMITILNKETGDCHSQRNSHPTKVRAVFSKQKANKRRFGPFYYLA